MNCSISDEFATGVAITVVPLWLTTASSLYRSSISGLNTAIFCLANCERLMRRINSSDFPENMLPQITSIQPPCIVTYMLDLLPIAYIVRFLNCLVSTYHNLKTAEFDVFYFTS